MSLEPRYQHHSDKTLAKLRNLDSLEQVAAAAGHGYAQLNPKLNLEWVDVEFDPENVRPSYDANHIQTFSPDLVQALLFELSESRKALEGARKLVAESVPLDQVVQVLSEFDNLVKHIPAH